MSSARTVLVFGLYLVLVGLGLLLAPNPFLAPLGFPATQDFWPRVTGVLVLCLAAYYLVAARANLTPLIRATVFVRLAVFGLFGALVLLQIAPRPLALLGLIDLVAALWTAMALKSERAAE
jgi:hypothetical protein